MLNLNHKNLDVWKLSLNIIKELYLLTEKFPKTEIYGLTAQIRRASLSLPLNIAEGSSRKSATERKRFFEISRSSLVEIDTALEIGLFLNFIEVGWISSLDDKINHLFAMLTNLINKT